MIVVTGAGGFIGSNLVKYLNSLGMNKIICVDDWSDGIKVNLSIDTYDNTNIPVDREQFMHYLNEYGDKIKLIYHLGARTDTTEMDVDLFNKLNLQYTTDVWNACVKYRIPLIYASSAATYGDGKLGYEDNELQIPKLRPLNPYGDSKQYFDKWAVSRVQTPPFWIGLKFFNVYGYGEYNKGRMASVVFHAINQIKETGKMKLFRSHNPDYTDGGQMRDFISVNDVVRVCHEFSEKGVGNSGIYNLGTGKARTFLDLANGVFDAMGIEPNIEFIDTPEDIRDKYQYFTQATTDKLNKAGIDTQFIDLEDGIKAYVNMVM